MRNLRKIEKPLALLSFLCLFPAGMSAQSIVKGVVTDPSGEPVIGATVKAAGSKLGVVLIWMVSLALMLHLMQH